MSGLISQAALDAIAVNDIEAFQDAVLSTVHSIGMTAAQATALSNAAIAVGNAVNALSAALAAQGISVDTMNAVLAAINEQEHSEPDFDPTFVGLLNEAIGSELGLSADAIVKNIPPYSLFSPTINVASNPSGKSCRFQSEDGASYIVAPGKSRKAFASDWAQHSCRSQLRVCNGSTGQLSGSYMFAQCYTGIPR